MPWRHTSPMDQKTQWIAESLRDRLSGTERCALYGVSRKTGDKGIARSLTPGPHGRAERSRRPNTAPRHTPDSVGAALLDARRRPPSGGAKTLVAILRTPHALWPWPARSTVCAILRRHGLGPKPRKRRVIGQSGQPTSAIQAPTAVWRADFKGHCTTGDGRSGAPLTITEGDRRFLLGCQALASTRVAAAKPVFRRVVQAFALPKRIRTDHGVPCATPTRARLSQ